MILDYLIGILIFVFGLCIGSFLNCVIYRLPDESPTGHSDGPATMPAKRALGGERSLLRKLQGRSFCPSCKHVLSWKDLAPVFSFIFLCGKCRYCHKKISIQYPLVEAVTGLVFFLIYYFFISQGSTVNFTGMKFTVYLNLAFLFYVSSVLIIIFVYDLKHYIIPDKILFPAIGIAFVYRIFQNLSPVSIGGYFSAALIGSGFFLFIFLISGGRWIGFGDVKLAILLGLILGFPNILAGLFLAFFLGAIIGIILMIFGKSAGWRIKSEIPFGPFLITGTFIALFFGNAIINWYLKFLV